MHAARFRNDPLSLSVSMRALLYVSLLSAWALSIACVATPKAEEWLAVGYRTPEQTFRTFQTGLRASQPDIEYRCFSSALKARTGLVQLGYLEFRRELFQSHPWLKYAAWAEVRALEELGDGRVRLVAEVDTWFYDKTFALDLVREDFYELWARGARVADDETSWPAVARVKGSELVVSVPLASGLGLGELGEVRVGREWKIDGFPELEGSASGP